MRPGADTSAEEDAAAVLDPDTFVEGVPYQALARLRRHSPVHPVDVPGLPRIWLVTRHADVQRVSRDTATFSSATGNTLVSAPATAESVMLPGLDPPRHTRYRKLVQQGFTARNVARWEERIRRIARDIAGSVVLQKDFDAVREVSVELSMRVLAELLGVPVEDRERLFRWSNAIGSLGIEDPDYAPSAAAVSEAISEFTSYFLDDLRRRRGQEPGEDLISVLRTCEVDGERLTAAQLLEFFILLVVAGNETTRNTLTHGIHALAAHPDQQSALHADRGLVPGAVEEMLRWATPVMHFRRTVTTGVELGGRHVPAGDWVLMHYLSANRDDDVFDRAERFDVTRRDVRQAAFGGGGVHLCLGAHLARLELRVMVEELYTVAPGLRITGPPVRLRSSFFNGIKSLPCTTGESA